MSQSDEYLSGGSRVEPSVVIILILCNRVRERMDEIEVDFRGTGVRGLIVEEVSQYFQAVRHYSKPGQFLNEILKLRRV